MYEVFSFVDSLPRADDDPRLALGLLRHWTEGTMHALDVRRRPLERGAQPRR